MCEAADFKVKYYFSIQLYGYCKVNPTYIILLLGLTLLSGRITHSSGKVLHYCIHVYIMSLLLYK